jgi:hypothetical protein
MNSGQFTVCLFPAAQELPYFTHFLENVSIHIEEELVANDILPGLIRIFLPIEYDEASNTVTLRHFLKPEEAEPPILGAQEKDMPINLNKIPDDGISSEGLPFDIYLFSNNSFAGVLQIFLPQLTSDQRNFIKSIIPRLTRSFEKLLQEYQKTIEKQKDITALQHYFQKVIENIVEEVNRLKPPNIKLTTPPWIEINYAIWNFDNKYGNQVIKPTLYVIPHPDQENYIKWLNAFLSEFASEGYFEDKYRNHLSKDFCEVFSNYKWTIEDPVQAPKLLFRASKNREPDISYADRWEEHWYVYNDEYKIKYGLEKIIFKNSRTYFLIAYPTDVVVAIVIRQGKYNKLDQEQQKKIEKILKEKKHIELLQEFILPRIAKKRGLKGLEPMVTDKLLR